MQHSWYNSTLFYQQGKGDDLARFPVSRRVMGESMKGKNCRVALLKPIPDDEDIRGAAVRPQAAVVDIQTAFYAYAADRAICFQRHIPDGKTISARSRSVVLYSYRSALRRLRKGKLFREGTSAYGDCGEKRQGRQNGGGRKELDFAFRLPMAGNRIAADEL